MADVMCTKCPHPAHAGWCADCNCYHVSLRGPADGQTFDAPRDETRLNLQREKVFDAMRDQDWHTLAEIEEATGYPQASISARIRDFRKPKFGSHVVERRYVERGLWEYRLVRDG